MRLVYRRKEHVIGYTEGFFVMGFDVPHGIGRRCDGQGIYEGMFINGFASGYGRMIISKTEVSIGHWKLDKLHGYAKDVTIEASGFMQDNIGLWQDGQMKLSLSGGADISLND